VPIISGMGSCVQLIAVRLPKDCRFDCDEVFVYKQGDTVVLSAKAPGWEEFFATAGEAYACTSTQFGKVLLPVG